MRQLGGLARKLEKSRDMEMKSKKVIRKAKKKDMMMMITIGESWSPRCTWWVSEV